MSYFFYLLMILTLLLSILIGPSRANQLSCYSFVPYGYTEFFNKLIPDSDDCYIYFKKEVKFKSGSLGERLIIQTPENGIVIGIGESQLMGIDWSDMGEEEPHDLRRLFGNKSLLIFAAPNNGPLQNLNRLKEMPKEEMARADAIVIGFNYSTDVFRLLNGWDHKKSSPIPYSMLSWPLFKYTLFDVTLLNSRLSGKQFGNSVFDPNSILKEYRSLEKHEIYQSFRISINKLVQEISLLNENIYLIIFPPYWALTKEGNLLPDIQRDFLQLACVSKKISGIKKIYFTNNERYTLSEDGRHFPQGTLLFYDKIVCYE